MACKLLMMMIPSEKDRMAKRKYCLMTKAGTNTTSAIDEKNLEGLEGVLHFVHVELYPDGLDWKLVSDV